MKKILALVVLCISLTGCGTSISQQRMRHLTTSTHFRCSAVVYSSEYLISARHCTDGHKHDSEFYYVNRNRIPVLWTSKTHDLVILKIDFPGNAPLKLADPKVGMSVFIYHGNKIIRGPITAVNKKIYIFKNVHLAKFKIKKGMSGSGVFNDAGELVGIVSHTYPSKSKPNSRTHTVIQPISEIIKGLEEIK